MRRTIALLPTMALTLLVASGLVLVAGGGSATADSSVVGPGESIQKAIKAADPGDTIIVRGVHREDVVIRKDGIKLRGDDAVIEPPARADSPCSRAFGPEAICVLGDVNLDTFEVKKRVKDVSVSGFTIRGFEEGGRGGELAFSIDLTGTRDATVAGNRTIGNVAGGVVVGGSIDTTVLNNDVIGNPKSDDAGILVADNSLNTKVVKNVVKNYPDGEPEGQIAIEVQNGATNTTIEENDLVGNWLGVSLADSPGTKILSNDITDSTLVGTVIVDSPGTKMLSNDISRSGETGILILGPKSANAKVVGNNIWGGPWGMYVANTKGGSIAGNTIRNNCAGVFFEADGFGPGEPVGGFEVTGNTVTDNTRSCRAAQIDRNLSGIGIALLGARDMEVTGNQISGNVPSGPTGVSGGVVVATDPFFGRTIKPRNNTVTGNHFGRNKPDIFWDGSGSGNRFIGNLCNTSVPTRLCD